MDSQNIELMKTLKLTFMLECYKNLNCDLAHLAQINLDQALLDMLTAEANGRDHKRCQYWLNNSHILDRNANISHITYDETRGEDFVKDMTYIRSMTWIDQGANLCLLGASGSGKSYIGSAICNENCRRGSSTVYFNAQELARLALYHKGESHKKYQTFKKNISRKKLLFIDDFCLLPHTQEELTCLFDILNERAGVHSTIVASQKNHNQWIEDCEYSAVAEAVAGRLYDQAKIIILKGKTRRQTVDGVNELDA